MAQSAEFTTTLTETLDGWSYVAVRVANESYAADRTINVTIQNGAGIPFVVYAQEGSRPHVDRYDSRYPVRNHSTSAVSALLGVAGSASGCGCALHPRTSCVGHPPFQPGTDAF